MSESKISFNYKVGDDVMGSLVPHLRYTPSEFVESYVKLPTIVSNKRAGPIKLQAFWKQILDSLETDPDATIRVIRSSAQLGKSTLILMVVIYNLFVLQQPVLIVLHSEDVAKKMLDDLKNIIKASPHLAKLYQDGRKKSKEDSFTLKNGIKCLIATAASARSLRSYSCGCVVLDEVDGYPRTLKNEGNPLELAEARTTSFPLTKNIWITSTPTTEQNHVSVELDRSYKKEWHINCPHCKAEIQIDWLQIKYPEKKTARELETLTAEYRWQCPECTETLTEREFRKVRETGFFKLAADQEDKARNRLGFQISGLMSVPITWKDLVLKWREGVTNPEKLRTFFNLSLGLPWSHAKKAVNSEVITKNIDHQLTVGQTPEHTLAIFLGVDLGYIGETNEYIHWCVPVAILPGGIHYVLDAVKAVGYQSLLDQLSRNFKTPKGRNIKIDNAFIDSGDGSARTHILNIIKNLNGVIPIKGINKQLEIFRWTKSSDGYRLGLLHRQLSLNDCFSLLETDRLKFVRGLSEEFYGHMQSHLYDTDTNEWVEKSKGIADHHLDGLRLGLVGCIRPGAQYRFIQTWAEWELANKEDEVIETEGQEPTVAASKPQPKAQVRPEAAQQEQPKVIDWTQFVNPNQGIYNPFR